MNMWGGEGGMKRKRIAKHSNTIYELKPAEPVKQRGAGEKLVSKRGKQPKFGGKKRRKPERHLGRVCIDNKY